MRRSWEEGVGVGWVGKRNSDCRSMGDMLDKFSNIRLLLFAVKVDCHVSIQVAASGSLHSA